MPLDAGTSILPAKQRSCLSQHSFGVIAGVLYSISRLLEHRKALQVRLLHNTSQVPVPLHTNELYSRCCAHYISQKHSPKQHCKKLVGLHVLLELSFTFKSIVANASMLQVLTPFAKSFHSASVTVPGFFWWNFSMVSVLAEIVLPKATRATAVLGDTVIDLLKCRLAVDVLMLKLHLW